MRIQADKDERTGSCRDEGRSLPLRKLLTLALVVIAFAAIHEGLHALAASAYGEYQAFHVRPFGLEVLFNTPVADRQGVQWAVISGVPNVATVVLGYLLVALRRGLATSGRRIVRELAYWFALLLILLDPLNLSVGPFLYGGDAQGIAVGFDVRVGVVQALSLVLLMVNRELAAQVVLPAFGVAATHPLLRPLLRLRIRSRSA